MARARNIKPGFFLNDQLAACHPLGRILFEGLWCLADREGRLEDRPARIKAEILPYDDIDVNDLLDELASRTEPDGSPAFIVRYEIGETRYIQVLNFLDHQNPHHREPESRIPAVPDHLANPHVDAKPRESLGISEARPGNGTDEPQPSPADSGFRIPDTGSLKGGGKNAPPVPAQEIVDAWNKTCGDVLPRVRHLTEPRRKKIITRCRDLRSVVGDLALDPEWWASEIFSKVRESPFCRGENGRGWKASLDWLMDRRDAAIKALEGQYDDTNTVSDAIAERYRALG
jgi:hypothetical protein